MPKAQPQAETKSQSAKFKAMAKELVADGDEKSLDETLSKIAKSKQMPKQG